MAQLLDQLNLISHENRSTETPLKLIEVQSTVQTRSFLFSQWQLTHRCVYVCMLYVCTRGREAVGEGAKLLKSQPQGLFAAT